MISNKEINQFILDFAEGVECKLWETDKTTCYVDCELVEVLGVDHTEDIDGIVLKDIMQQIVNRLNDIDGINAYIESSNEITAYKE